MQTLFRLINRFVFSFLSEKEKPQFRGFLGRNSFLDLPESSKCLLAGDLAKSKKDTVPKQQVSHTPSTKDK